MAQGSAPEINNFKGIIWILISVFGSSIMSVVVRGISADLDSRMIVLLRAGLTTAAIVIAFVALARFRKSLRFTHPASHLIRGGMIAISTHMGFYALANLPLATVTVLFFTAPIFATILAALWHRERVGLRRWSAVMAGFVGALIILRPGLEAFEPAMIVALGSSAFFAIALTFSRSLAHADGAASTFVSSVVITLIFSIPVAAPVFALPATFVIWLLVLVLVITGSLRSVADIQAYRYGEAGLIAPFVYLRLVVTGIAGYLLFDEVPDGPTWAGAAIIVAATLYISHRERQARRGRSAQAKGPA